MVKNTEIGEKSSFLLTKQVFLSLLVASFAAFISIYISKLYYNVAIFHYDSASYLYGALRIYDGVINQDKWEAIKAVLPLKDNLDLLLRIIFAPVSLKALFGHMYVSMPFFAFFTFLLFHYVFKRTQSWLICFVAVGSLFTLPLIYSPFLGMADYWKESVAIWILGCAVLAGLLSDDLKKMKWTFICGLMFALLLMERVALFIYVAILFVPIFSYIIYQRFQSDSLKKTCLDVFVLLFPILVVGSLVAIIQGQGIYDYYTKAGYDYVTRSYLANLIFKSMHSKLGVCYYLFPFIYIISGIFSGWKGLNKDVIQTVWLAIGFLLVVIVSRGMYHNVYNIETLFLVLLTATILPSYQSISGKNVKRIYNISLRFLCVLTIICCSLQVVSIQKQSKESEITFGPWKAFFENSTRLIMSQPTPRNYLFLFDESGALLVDHLQFHHNIRHDDNMKIVGTMFVHDSYYKAIFPNIFTPINNKSIDKQQAVKAQILLDSQNVKKMVKQNIKVLENQPGTLVFTYCSLNDIVNSPAFSIDGKNIAIPFVAQQMEYFLQSQHWKIIAKLNSPRGCLYVFQYSTLLLTNKVKWQAIHAA